jgi:hypothetical protein
MPKNCPDFQQYNSNDPNRGRQFDSILSLDFGIILLPVLGQSKRRGSLNGRSFLSYSDKCAVFHFSFLNRWVSLKESEFIYSKFHQINNSTTYQIHCMGGSSIP